MSLAHQISAYARFAWGLRQYLKEPATVELGRDLIRQRLRDRESNFLILAKRAIYDNDRSPYLPLLRMAGCEYGDLERMVCSDGIEASLTSLRDAGVYFTIDEFKGKKDVIRSNVVMRCRPEDFDNPFLTRSITTSSSGSRSRGTRTAMTLERLKYNALYNAVVFSSHGLLGKPTLLWKEILPSAAGLAALLQFCKMGVPPVRWFSPVAQRNIRPSFPKRLATLYVVYAGRLFGTRIPSPEYVSGEQVHVVADCLNDVLKRGQGCVVAASPSSAARLCHLARASGTDLSGVTFRTSGEPLSPAKMEEIRSVGAEAVNIYAFAEGSIVGYGCAGHKSACDDIHLLATSLAVIQHQRDTAFGGGTVDAFLFTSLFDKVPKILLNVESGDYGVVETRECDCELGSIGFSQHLHTIRSFDKLTGEGMTFVGTDLVHILEKVLPSRFGGFSTDYQMQEYEDAAGLTRLEVLVSPDVGDVNEEEVVAVILSELGRGGDTDRMMAEVWRQGKVLGVRRERPQFTLAGKLLTLNIRKQSESLPD